MGKDDAGINQGPIKDPKDRLRLAYVTEGVWTGAMVVFCSDPFGDADAKACTA